MIADALTIAHANARSFPGKSNVLLLMEAQSEWFKEFEQTEYKARTDDYMKLKEKFAEIFLRRMYKYVLAAAPLCSFLYARQRRTFSPFQLALFQARPI